MSFLAPQFLLVGAAASLLVIALHFIVTRQPKSSAFPTARFVPDTAVEAVSRSLKPSDLLLLLLRVLAIMSIASAFAGPIIYPPRQAKARIILSDISRFASSVQEVRDSVAAVFQPGDIVIAFDSLPRRVDIPDSLLSVRARGEAANLSAALIAAIRSARELSERADSISLIVVSPFARELWNPAADTIRSLWPGAITTVRVAQHTEPNVLSVSPVATDFQTGDPLQFSVALASQKPHAAKSFVVRSNQSRQTVDSGSVLLYWPVNGRPPLAVRTNPKLHHALVAGDAVVIAPFNTGWIFPADSLRNATVIARWDDGSAAAIQREVNGSCIRSTAIPVSPRGDLVIRSDFVALVSKLMSPCGLGAAIIPATDSLLVKLRGGTVAAAREAFTSESRTTSPYAIWLLILGTAFLVAEQLLRRRLSTGRDVTASAQLSAAA